MTTNLFFTFLPFQVLLKFFFMFLNEGVIIYYRAAYSAVLLLKVKNIYMQIKNQDEILDVNNKNDFKQLIRTKLLNITQNQADLFVKEAFRLKIAQAKDNVKLRRASLLYSKTSAIYYLPIPSSPSTLIESQHYLQEFETIWEWLPDPYRLYDPFLVFSTLKNGYSLNYLYTTCEKYLHHPMLLVGISDYDTIFGVFSDVMLQLTENQNQKFIGGEDTFVFLIKPQPKKFMSTGKNQDHLYGCTSYFSFGSGKYCKKHNFILKREGPAFQIDSELNQCYTNHSETYNNYKLNFDLDVKRSTEFRCLKIEIYCLK